MKLTLAGSGAIWVSGEIGPVSSNYLRFGFRTDQTVLAPLIHDLAHALATPP